MRNSKYLQKIFFLLVMGCSLCTLQACSSDDEDDEDPFDAPSEETTSIAVTGEVT